MKKDKDTKEIWNKIQAISTAWNSIFGTMYIVTLQTQLFETSIVLTEHSHAWPILIGIAA